MSDFEHLNDSQRAEAMLNAARSALAAWGWRDANASLLSLRSNAVYRVERGGQQAVVRVHWPGRKSQARIDSELALLAHLGGLGINAPRPLAASVRVSLTEHTPAICTLVAWQDGETVPVDQFMPRTRCGGGIGHRRAARRGALVRSTRRLRPSHARHRRAVRRELAVSAGRGRTGAARADPRRARRRDRTHTSGVRPATRSGRGEAAHPRRPQARQPAVRCRPGRLPRF
ncbi:MAG: phosphotransferase [Chloroflexi bacterium]|nr:phosphotransferase [Chloroflexota bacterium]